jgi:hypothetical protein
MLRVMIFFTYTYHIFFFIFFLISKGERKWKETTTKKIKNYEGVSLSLLILREERKGESSGMLPNTKWEVAHLATECAEN